MRASAFHEMNVERKSSLCAPKCLTFKLEMFKAGLDAFIFAVCH